MAIHQTTPIQQLSTLLPGELAQELEAPGMRLGVEEIRIRSGRRVCYMGNGWEKQGQILCDPPFCRRLLEALCEHSAYAMEEELREGFFTVAGGCRVGVSGSLLTRDGIVKRMGEVCGFNIRIAREVRGCANALIPYLVQDGRAAGMLVLSKPGVGKTTLLRDAGRQLSDGDGNRRGMKVAIADERGELAGMYRGAPSMDVGERTDVMDGCPKAFAIASMIRSMSPQVIVTDEIGGEAEAGAILDGANCGVAVLASAHASNIDEAMRRPAIRALVERGCFCYAAVIGRDAYGNRMIEVRELGA